MWPSTTESWPGVALAITHRGLAPQRPLHTFCRNWPVRQPPSTWDTHLPWPRSRWPKLLALLLALVVVLGGGGSRLQALWADGQTYGGPWRSRVPPTAPPGRVQRDCAPRIRHGPGAQYRRHCLCEIPSGSQKWTPILMSDSHYERPWMD
ncbi:uncharacterized protein LOC143675600 [Tamandua tetradactyla]|uniref:uncharacterized protein LOC143675600 n=1 Tax=Tamandua tetradactyla TaxID=48850 RepID=UPI004053DD4F